MQKILTSFAELETGDHVIMRRERQGSIATVEGPAMRFGSGTIRVDEWYVYDPSTPRTSEAWTLVRAERDVPPPPQPTGLGAVVVTQAGTRYTRVRADRWIAEGYDQFKTWPLIADDVVEVLSEGWTAPVAADDDLPF